ncbi:hypothetical protein NBRC110019_01550 [Neptunitalea chrysea]|uniref:Putative auto-transporter adhesin head GIN domain-containing protein n=1 Tax=Neptunitalea chrysea TaxID=1647581 RepID=A0A9W6B2M4_9FLAO|nr:hypothetical protein NBRC110019_01550 [Neptunitalea chrysea]
MGCNSESTGDCFQTTGGIIQQEVAISGFSEIEINEGISLYLTQGTTESVLIETGENLINDVEVYIENNRLVVKDHNSCNYVRNYNVTKVYVTAVSLTKIINNSQFDVHAENTLTYPSLELISENYEGDGLAVGNFYLNVQNTSLIFTFNDWSSAYITGATNNLTVNFYSGDSRFEGAGLVAQNVSVYHRSTNDIIIYPVNSLSGQIVSTGNIIAKNVPAEVSVSTPYIGRVIVED